MDIGKTVFTIRFLLPKNHLHSYWYPYRVWQKDYWRKLVEHAERYVSIDEKSEIKGLAG